MVTQGLRRFLSVLGFGFAWLLCAGLLCVYLWHENYRNTWCTDNEKFYDLMLSFGGAGLSLGIVTGMMLYDSKWYQKIAYGLEVILRYALAYFLFSYAVNQILDLSYPESYALLGNRVSDLNSGQLILAFFGHTYGYQAFLGWAQLIAGSLLFFRISSPLGLVVIIAITGNMMLIEHYYNLCRTTEAALYFITAVFTLLPFAGNLMNTLLLNRSSYSIANPVFQNRSHGYRALNILKIVLITGILIFYYNRSSRYINYYKANASSPIVGVWKVDEVDYKTSTNDAKKLFDKFQNFYLEERRYGAVMVGDSLSYFEYMVDTTYHQLEFWNFHDFKELDLKGKYQLLAHDTLLYNGKNGTDTLEMRLVLDKNFKKLR